MRPFGGVRSAMAGDATNDMNSGSGTGICLADWDPFWSAAFLSPAAALPIGPWMIWTAFARPDHAAAPHGAAATAPAPASLAAASVAAIPASAGVPLTAAPAVPQPGGVGQIVGMVLQNPTAGTLAARYVTLGMNFSDGQVPSGQGLAAAIGGSTEPVQMDVKTRYADGSVQSAVLTLRQPALAAQASTAVMLVRSGAAVTGAPLDIAALANAATYDVTVSLTHIVQAASASGGATMPVSTTAIPDVTIHVGQLLAQALAGGSAAGLSYWQQGPLATQVRIDSGQIAGTPLHLTFDVTLFADGSTFTDVQFNNDIAMQPSLGSLATSLTYDVAITRQSGGTRTTVLQQAGIAQAQYQTWDAQVWSNGAPAVNVQHDVAALEKTGAVPAYDLGTGVATSLITAETTALNTAPAFGILGGGSATTGSATGTGADAGVLPGYDAAWLVTQTPGAAAYALAQANQAGTVPWAFYDPATNAVLSVADWPKLGVGTGASAANGLSQPVGQAATASIAVPQPDLAYAAYLLTGQRVYLDALNAEAGASVLATAPAARQGGQGIVVGASLPAAWQASALREVVEAAAANPDGSAMKAYFTRLAANNIAFLLQEAASSGEAAVSGWFAGLGAAGQVSVLQEDTLATTLGMAAGLDIPGARQVLGWMANFVAGLFLNGASGLPPAAGADAVLQVADAASGAPFTTWAQVAAASGTAGLLGNGRLTTDTAALATARAALADIITYTGATDAMRAYGWLMANAPALATSIPQQDPTLDIVPRLSDGTLLGNAQVFVRNDSATMALTVHAGSGDQMVVERGTGPVTIIGGSGINILLGGAGATTLVGGPMADELFAGTGPTTFLGGSGNDVMQAGSGAAAGDLFILSPGDTGNDVIAGLRIGTDHLQIAGAAPGSASLRQLLAGATQDAGGSAVLHLSTRHQVTLQGIPVADITGSLFS